MNRNILIIAIVAAALINTGCASLTVRDQAKRQNQHVGPYPGIQMMTHQSSYYTGIVPIGGILLLDAPFSFALDTVLLPVDAVSAATPTSHK